MRNYDIYQSVCLSVFLLSFFIAQSVCIISRKTGGSNPSVIKFGGLHEWSWGRGDIIILLWGPHHRNSEMAPIIERYCQVPTACTCSAKRVVVQANL